MTPAAILLALLIGSVPQETAAGACATWEQCRELAIEAAARQDYETFHDLAWRAVQRGPRNHPELMAMLARAQSLSGRPLDALVMLQRLARLGVETDAAESDDFRRVRALAAWGAFEEELAVLRAAGEVKRLLPDPRLSRISDRSSVAGTRETAATRRSSGTEAARPEEAEAGSPEAIPLVPAPPTITAPGVAVTWNPPALSRSGSESAPPIDAPAAEAALPGGSPDALRFSMVTLSPSAFIHDAVSNRFIIADRGERRLAVLGERSRRLSILAMSESAGFGEITGLAIDTREGDLWVISRADEAPSARLHKLQLISGRLLYEVPLPERLEPAQFVDVAVAPGSSEVLVLDAEGRRVLRVAPRSRELRRAATLDRDGLASIAPAPGSTAYVAHASGVSRLDLSSGSARELKASAGVRLEDVHWVRYYDGALVAVQRTGEGRHRVVRFQLDAAGRSVRSEVVLDSDAGSGSPPAAVLSGETLYYLAETPAPDFSGAVDAIVRRIVLK